MTTRTRTINQFNDRIEKIATELSSVYSGNLLYAAGANAFTIIDYIVVMKTETNYTNHYGNDTIGALCRFSKYHINKLFKDITRNDQQNGIIENSNLWSQKGISLCERTRKR